MPFPPRIVLPLVGTNFARDQRERHAEPKTRHEVTHTVRISFSFALNSSSTRLISASVNC